LRNSASKVLQRRQRGVALAETLHAAAFLVHADQQRAAGGGADRGRQLGHLRARGEVALEQHHAGHGIVLQPVTLLRGQFGAGNADHQHGGVLRDIAPTRSGRALSQIAMTRAFPPSAGGTQSAAVRAAGIGGRRSRRVPPRLVSAPGEGVRRLCPAPRNVRR
jgi:hypothetical protein